MDDLSLGLVVVVPLVADPVEKLAQVVPRPTKWLLQERPWHLSAEDPFSPAAHSAPGTGVIFLFAAVPLSPQHSPDLPLD